MRDWLKFLLAVGLGVALALVVALPIVLTDSDESFVADEGSQRFPEPNFVKFDNLWDGTLSRKTIGNAFSKIDGFEDYYICTSSEEDSKATDMKFWTQKSTYKVFLFGEISNEKAFFILQGGGRISLKFFQKNGKLGHFFVN
jgi:hypothetical protein